MGGDHSERVRGPADVVEHGGNVVVLSGGRVDYELPNRDTDTPELYVTTDGRGGALDAATADRDAERFGHVETGGGGTRSAASTTSGPSGLPSDPVDPDDGSPAPADGPHPDWYSRVADPADLADLARHVDAHLTRLSTGTGERAAVRLYVDSLDPYVGSVAGPRFFRFLHVLTARVRSVGGVGQFYLDPALDELFARSLEPLFEAVVEPEPGTGVDPGSPVQWGYRTPDTATGTSLD